MQTINVKSWQGFGKKLDDIRKTEHAAGREVEFLFRGHSNSAWPLSTTLERCGHDTFAFSKYFRLISAVKPQIETFTGRTWELKPFPEVEALLCNWDTISLRTFPDPQTYSYMVHLRHHGFPSPLLDWTLSPYVAGYFAFRSNVKPLSGKVAIYVYSESPNRRHASGSHKPFVRRFGRYVTTHKRHFLQQSDYTLSLIFDGAWSFTHHEEVFAKNDPAQDFLWKFKIPWSVWTCPHF
jgi:hypothetical protein